MLSANWRVFIPAVMFAVVATAGTSRAQQSSEVSGAGEGDTREANLRAYAELLRADLRAEKVAVITEVMQFTDDEDAKFWPVYREYEVELNRLNDDRLGLIRAYAKSYQNITDSVADELVSHALDLEARRTALKQKYYQRLKGVLSPKTAARFLQVENQLLLLIDLQIAASLPLAQ
jgi:hypothetical protein